MISDSDVKKDVEHELEWNAGHDASGLAVAVKRGVVPHYVVLNGTVKAWAGREEVERAAWMGGASLCIHFASRSPVSALCERTRRAF